MIPIAPTALVAETPSLSAYLAASATIDFDCAAIQTLVQQFLGKTQTELERAQIIYEFVRDRISHSFDIESKTVTCTASQVLQYQEGICFAKAHLLAALYRGVGIPAGFCYQRLVFDDAQPEYLTLHGLNAVYLQELQRWIRLDARGNKPGVQAEFSLDQERLAYPVRSAFLEVDYPTIYAQPNPGVIEALQTYPTPSQLACHLPVEL